MTRARKRHLRYTISYLRNCPDKILNELTFHLIAYDIEPGYIVGKQFSPTQYTMLVELGEVELLLECPGTTD